MDLTFPDDFDPFTATDAQIAVLVRKLWEEAAAERMATTIPFSEADLHLYCEAPEDE